MPVVAGRWLCDCLGGRSVMCPFVMAAAIALWWLRRLPCGGWCRWWLVPVVGCLVGAGVLMPSAPSSCIPAQPKPGIRSAQNTGEISQGKPQEKNGNSSENPHPQRPPGNAAGRHSGDWRRRVCNNKTPRRFFLMRVRSGAPYRAVPILPLTTPGLSQLRAFLARGAILNKEFHSTPLCVAPDSSHLGA